MDKVYSPERKRRGDLETPPPLALRPREAARALGIGERKLWEITADQASGIPHVRFGRRIVYPAHLLQQWLAEKASTKRW